MRRNINLFSLAFDDLYHTLQIERLRQHTVEVLAIVHVAKQAFHVRCNGYEPCRATRGVAGPKRGGHLEPIHLRQMKVHQDDIELFGLQRLERVLAIGGDVNIVAALLEQQLQQILGDLVIFSHQHLLTRRLQHRGILAALGRDCLLPGGGGLPDGGVSRTGWVRGFLLC